mmetsp:Transcript_20729/g.34143  ORF Transcript_20729/g.34143 Transcript_20729/m.34143 type:complete len:592 (+) Transcript_20729:61-1836(+)
MAGASPRKAKRSPRQSPRVRAKPGSPGVRAKAPHESVIPASVFWSGAETAKPKATVSASSSTLGSDSRNTGAALDEAPVPLATVDLWEAQGGGTTLSTPRTLTPPQGQVRVPLQAQLGLKSEADVEKVETSSEASKELATASTLLAPGGSLGSPAWNLSRQTWSPRIMSPVNRTTASTWSMPSRQSWSPRVGAGTMTPLPPDGPQASIPKGEVQVAKTPTAPTASMVLLSGTNVPARPLLPINRVEPPLAQPTASPRYCLRRDVASAWALSSGCSSVPTPMVRECQTPAMVSDPSPAVRHGQSLPGGATPERPSAARRSPRLETKPGSAGDPGSQAPQDTGIPASPFSAASGSLGAIAQRSPRVIPPGVGTGGTTPTCTTPVPPPGRTVNGDSSDHPDVKVTALTAVPRMPMSWLPRERVEPPLAPTASPRYCFRRDVASTLALGSGCASVPTPNTPNTPAREAAPPPSMAAMAAMSPAMRHARSLPGGTVSLTPRRQEGQKLSHMPSVIPWVPGLQEPMARKVEPGPTREAVPKLSEILNADVSLRYNASGHTQVRKQRLAGRTGNMTEDKEGYWEVAEGGGKQEFIYTV